MKLGKIEPLDIIIFLIVLSIVLLTIVMVKIIIEIHPLFFAYMIILGAFIYGIPYVWNKFVDYCNNRKKKEE